MIKRTFVIATLLLMAVTVRAVDFTFGAAMSSGFSLANGTDLAPGSLVRLGTFSLSNSQITANAGNLTLLDASFQEITFATIGEGDPGGFDSSSDARNAGLFNHALNGVDTTATGLNLAGGQLYYWVFDAPTMGAATQQGIFTSATWIIPSGTGTLGDPALDTDITDLTTGQDGLHLATDAQIPIGGFGPGVNTTGSDFGGGTDFDLVAITAVPEPSAYALAAGALSFGIALARRRQLIGK